MNCICRSCSNKRNAKPHSEFTKKKISSSKIGSIPWNKGTVGLMPTWNKGKTGIYSLETRKKMRVRRCQWIIRHGGGPQFSLKACEFLDKLSKEKKWNLQHAMNGGEYYIKELGYWIDGYDKERNIIVEYDEPFHNRLSKKNRDINRQNEIIKFLKPIEFWRYKEFDDRLERVA